MVPDLGIVLNNKICVTKGIVKHYIKRWGILLFIFRLTPLINIHFIFMGLNQGG